MVLKQTVPPNNEIQNVTAVCLVTIRIECVQVLAVCARLCLTTKLKTKQGRTKAIFVVDPYSRFH